MLLRTFAFCTLNEALTKQPKEPTGHLYEEIHFDEKSVILQIKHELQNTRKTHLKFLLKRNRDKVITF